MSLAKLNTGKRTIILTIDDDRDMLKLISRHLTGVGYTVISADRATKALRLFEKVKPDLILLDINIPEMDGWSFARRLHSNSELSKIPIIFVTAFARETDKALAYASGGADFLQKPFKKAVLLEMVKKHLAHKVQLESSQCGNEVKASGDFSGFLDYVIKKANIAKNDQDRLKKTSRLQLYDLCDKFNVNSKYLSNLVAEYSGIPHRVFINPEEVDNALLPAPYCRENMVLPLMKTADSKVQEVMLSNPFNHDLLAVLKERFGSESLQFNVVAPETIAFTYDAAPGAGGSQIALVKGKQFIGGGNEGGGTGSTATAKNSQAVNVAANILSLAVSQRASDIHFEPKEKFAQVLFRVDGDMMDVYQIKPEVARMVISRLKAVGGLDIAEHRKPQDGSVDALVDGRNYRLRLATTSTYFGESLVIRILEPEAKPRKLETLGMTSEQAAAMQEFASGSQGLVLIVGPTGSGKTTTIYSFLFLIDYHHRSLMTVEDPVEYEIPFANQQQVNEKAGVTFDALLKSSVRQDPDVLFVGEIRDQNSARTGMDFASTGHLMVTTLHSSNAITAIMRLERLGVSRRLFADSVLGIVAQRLIKKLCVHCRVIKEITPKETQRLARFTTDIPEMVAHPMGCTKCKHSGYLGREAIYEVIHITPDISRMIREGLPISDIREYLRSKGVCLISTHAMEKARKFIFSIDDVYSKILVEEISIADRVPSKAAEGSAAPVVNTTPSSGSVAKVESAKKVVALSAAEVPQGAKGILVIDDDRDTRNLLGHFLKSSGYHIDMAESGPDALDLLSQKWYDLILSDVRMPGMDGFELIERMEQKNIAVPVIFLTAADSIDDQQYGLRLGAIDYIHKPIKRRQLLERIGNALDAKNSRMAVFAEDD